MRPSATLTIIHGDKMAVLQHLYALWRVRSWRIFFFLLVWLYRSERNGDRDKLYHGFALQLVMNRFFFFLLLPFIFLQIWDPVSVVQKCTSCFCCLHKGRAAAPQAPKQRAIIFLFSKMYLKGCKGLAWHLNNACVHWEKMWHFYVAEWMYKERYMYYIQVIFQWDLYLWNVLTLEEKAEVFSHCPPSSSVPGTTGQLSKCQHACL